MYYSLFNLTFDSQFPLVNIPIVSKPSGQCIPINNIDKIDIDLSTMHQVGAYCWVSPSNFVLKVPQLAHFHVQGGQSISVAVEYGADAGLLTTYLQGYMLAILLQQRGHLVLHGTVLQRDGLGIAICGDSGSGKSTLAASLLQQGWALVSDDLCVFDSTGRVMLGCNDLKIWPDVACVLQMSGLSPFAQKLEKLQYIPAIKTSSNECYTARSYPLIAVYCLSEEYGDDITEFKGMRKFAPLKANSYRSHFMPSMEHEALFMRLCSEFLGKTPVFALSRGKGKLSLEKLHELSFLVNDSLEEQI